MSVTDRAALNAAVADDHRSEANRARDKYRHPAETLSFIGVRRNQTVVEFLPGAGWYMEILAPYLSANGHYIALVQADPAAQARAVKLITDGGARYAGARATSINFLTGETSVAPASADVVLTFRNIHDLMKNGPNEAETVLEAFYKMLKPGGVLGVEDHRLPEDRDSALEQTSGYLKQSTVVHLAVVAGFCFAGSSEINANLADDADHPQGVWALPPTLRNGDVDRVHYLAIGESDRMTLRFTKPKHANAVCPKGETTAANPFGTKVGSSVVAGAGSK